VAVQRQGVRLVGVVHSLNNQFADSSIDKHSPRRSGRGRGLRVDDLPYTASFQHLIEVAGIDHVCMGADFDDGGGFPGLDNVSLLPRITERLKAGGMSDDGLAKVWNGNLLRVMEAAEKQAH
jgi:microsomal dipeptidase-like Zn-dependent dipeptidase